MSTLPLPMMYRCVPASCALNTVSPLANDTSCIRTAICAVNTELQGAKVSVLLSRGNLQLPGAYHADTSFTARESCCCASCMRVLENMHRKPAILVTDCFERMLVGQFRRAACTL